MEYSLSLTFVMQMAANETVESGYGEIEPEYLLLALLQYVELDLRPLFQMVRDESLRSEIKSEHSRMQHLLAERGINPGDLSRRVRHKMGNGGLASSGAPLHRSAATKQVFARVEEKAKREGTPVGALELLEKLLADPTPVVRAILPAAPTVAETLLEGLALADATAVPNGLSLSNLTQTVSDLRRQLRYRVFGQEHAIEDFIEGLFAAELARDEDRKRPVGLFVFAGPPGVGKTYLANTAAEYLKKPFKRFDMSSFSGYENASALVGNQPMYRGAQPGLLTSFVKDHPDAVLLFDEIEKAAQRAILYFLQVLDSARLEDHFTEEAVDFSQTILIFTTNAGRSLYENFAAGARWHRRTVLAALGAEKSPLTGTSVFPEAVCSRLATGCPVMFNRLGISELERIAEAQLRESGTRLAGRMGMDFSYSEEVPLCLLLREGGFADARTVCAQVDTFVKNEVFKFCRMLRQDRLVESLERAAELRVELEQDGTGRNHELDEFITTTRKPRVLLITAPHIARLWQDQLPDAAEWRYATNLPDMSNCLSTEDFDFVLLDMWVDSGSRVVGRQTGRTLFGLDSVPLAASSVATGLQMLRKLGAQYPYVPCYLLQFSGREQRYNDEELTLACIRNGARGTIQTGFVTTDLVGWQLEAEQLRQRLSSLWAALNRQALADRLAGEQKVLRFDTVPRFEPQEDKIRIVIRNLDVTQALQPGDVTDVLSEVDRPKTSFLEIFGAAAAKEELRYIVDWLRDPLRHGIQGTRPPRGVLLYGPSGTGKTSLVRAVAGESRAAILAVSAANFVTKWQGSGPENIKILFEKARRYAPAIVFIDEIDAIGKTRQGSLNNQATEQALNALLVEMDGFVAGRTRKPVVVIAATNIVETLDTALRRRFDREVEVDRPDRDARMAYLRYRLQGRYQSSVDEPGMERLASQTAGYTVADLERVIELAGRLASRAGTAITSDLIEEAFERFRLGERRPLSNRNILLRIARHEAGHCLLSCLAGRDPIQVSIISRNHTGGFVENQSDEEFALHTKSEIEDRIRIAMGGRAAELLYYGPEEGLSTGASSDLRKATAYANAMVAEFGMGHATGPVAIDGDLPQEARAEMASIVRIQLQKALELLRNDQTRLDRLVEELLSRNRLTGEEIAQVLA